MLNRARMLSLLVALSVTTGAAGCAREAKESPTQGRLVVVVSEPYAALIARQAALFESLYAEARVTVRPVATREAFVALLADSVRLVVVDRPPNAEELAAMNSRGRSYEGTPLALDALVLAVNATNALPGVTTQQAADLLTGRARDWADLPHSGRSGPVRLVLTGRNSGAYELLINRFLPADAVVGPAATAPDQSAALARVAADPDGLAVLSGVVLADADSVRALAIEAPDSIGTLAPRSPHQANIHRGYYPWRVPVAVCFDRRSRLAAGFAAFLASAPGQKGFLDAGLVPVTMPVRLVHLK
jgi:phosphate transport system substrate-binding protein